MSDFTYTVIGYSEDNGKGGRKFVPKDEVELKAFKWAMMRDPPGTAYVVGFKRWRPPNTQNQRGYLHGVVLKTIARETGADDLKTLYADLKRAWRPTTLVSKDGTQEMPMTPSLRESDTVEYSEFIDWVIRWAGDFLGLTIPPPDRSMLSEPKPDAPGAYITEGSER